MNHIINSTLNWFTGHPLYIALLAVVLLALAFGGANSCASRKYDKERQAYEAQSKQWAADRVDLIATAEAKEKRIAELEPKAIAFDALAEEHKRIDAGLAQQVEEVSKNAAEAEARAEMPVDCRVRAQRVCDLLRANNIKHDCGRITAESCAAR